MAVGNYPQPLQITQAVTIVGKGKTGTSSTATVIGPTSLIAQNGFQGYDAASVKVSKDTVRRNSYTGDATDNVPSGEADYGWGLQLDSTANPVSVTDNKVLDSAGTALPSPGQAMPR